MQFEESLREFGRLICRVAAGEFLSRQESLEAYRQVILNEQPELQQGAFLMAHITREPSTEELCGAWDALDLYDTAKITTTVDGPVCDIVGTGSDPLKTINCSTPAALIASACGLRVAKKGARLVTGVSGASDILEVLGIDLGAPCPKPRDVSMPTEYAISRGEAFLKSGWARLIRSMRFTSAFNIIGPLTRPCPATSSIVIGAYSPRVCDQLIAVLKDIGMPSAVAPYGMVDGIDRSLGMDEFSLSGPTRVVELRNRDVLVYEVTPQDFGLDIAGFESIASRRNAPENAAVILDVLQGRYDTPAADFFCMNAAAALYISGVVPTYSAGTDMARQALAQGKALEKLHLLQQFQGAGSPGSNSASS